MRYVSLIMKGLPGALIKEFRFFSLCRLSNVLVRFCSWQRRLSLRLNNFHAYPFMRRNSILEENDFFFFFLVALRGRLMKRQQRQQIISPTCGFAAKASGKLFSVCLAVELTTSCSFAGTARPEAAGGTSSSCFSLEHTVCLSHQERTGQGRCDCYQAGSKRGEFTEHPPTCPLA